MYILGPPVNVYNFTTYLIFPFQVSMHIASQNKLCIAGINWNV